MTTRQVYGLDGTRGLKRLAATRDGMVLRLLAKLSQRLTYGGLQLTLPSGCEAIVGAGPGPFPHIVLSNYAVVRRALLRGPLGFAESYINGDVATDDLAGVFRFFIDNFETLSAAGRGVFSVRTPDRLAHRLKPNSKSGSRKNIAAHYDLGNDFYALWLDPGMTYSSGIYETAKTTLELAQARKYETIIKALDIAPGDRVLEIGCGWGGMAQTLAERGADVTAITVSSQQYNYARRRIARACLEDLAEIRFQDYRDVEGEFDAIVSVEMIEAVGENHWPTYFGTLANRLKPGGRAVLQVITIDEAHYEGYRRNPDFIQRYIFPGGMLPTPEIMAHWSSHCALDIETLQTFAKSYAYTLRDWRDRFHDAWPHVSNLGFDDRFKRMWDYYLTYCEAGFERGVINVGLYKLTKPGA